MHVDPDSNGKSTRHHPAALASNWRGVLAVDAAMGLVVLVGGFVLSVLWMPALGAGIGALGVVYMYLVWRRARSWQEQRHEAGLDR